MSRPRFFALLLALVTLLVFLPAGRFNFVNYDDTDYVTENPAVKAGLTWAGVQWAFTSFRAGNWHPLTWLSHMADGSLFGLNPGAHHFVNVLLHSANVALLCLLLWRLTQRIGPSALVAALFAWHPLHVESVAWIAERKDVLSGFFFLLTLLAYTRYARLQGQQGRKPAARMAQPRAGQPAASFYVLALGCFALGLLAKPMLVTLPFVLLLLDYWPLARWAPDGFRRALVIEKIPFFALTAVSCVVTFFAQRGGEAVVSLARVPLGYRLENAPVAVAGYLRNFFWPADLCVLYPMAGGISALQAGFSVALLLGVTAAAWHWRSSRPYFITGWLWFLGMLVPVIGLVQVGGQAMADRYTYLPSIGFFVALVFLADAFADRRQTPQAIRLGLAGLLSVACILGTERQLQFWRDSETLFRRAIAATRDNAIALVNLGVALDVQGRFAEALEVYHQAEQTAHPPFQVHKNLGNVLSLLGRHAESLAEYQQALAQRPDNAALHNAAGGELAALGRWDEALTEFTAAARLNPGYAAPHLEAAKVLFKLGRDAEGGDKFHTALRLEPNNYQSLATVAHYLAANENAAARDARSALALALKADELSGHVQPVVHDFLGMAFAENGDFSNAVLCAENALALAASVQMRQTGAMQQRLELYRQNQPWRESFRATNAPGKK